ncbi:hypothetical protein LIZ91_06435 [Enterococcus avium]|jgi:hypothetical protein|uniref:hypothetical protein n=1 Tax=Enterococcus avium TaxID=33945 RepID=UPI001D07AE25|nr:hypothetical protein [Enterococcus avium]MCB6916221.1 hypothetical protein [Enterococcus avium]MCQ4960077.1 hypothetical protein [Enterococcus avium]
MTVTVTVYLKNGMNVSLDVPDTTLEDQRVLYSEAFKKEKEVSLINHVGSGSIELIPVDNVALIQIKEK